MRKDSTLVDQVLILDAFDALIEVLSDHCDATILLDASIGLFQACHDKERANNIYRRTLSVREQKFVAAKYMVMRRLIDVPSLQKILFDSEVDEFRRQEFVSKLAYRMGFRTIFELQWRKSTFNNH